MCQEALQHSVLSAPERLLFQKFCSDPYKLHTKKIKSDLVVVSVDIYKKNPIFLPGQKVCRKCQTRLSKEEDASGEGVEGGEGRRRR